MKGRVFSTNFYSPLPWALSARSGPQRRRLGASAAQQRQKASLHTAVPVKKGVGEKWGKELGKGMVTGG